MELQTSEINDVHFLYPGLIFARTGFHIVTTILGSCVAVCLWTPNSRIGGINHFMLPFWNGEGLPSPKYGNVAIPKLIEKMATLGIKREHLRAKIFGGSSLLQNSSGLLVVGERNIMLAEELLKEEKIPIVSRDVGGSFGRKLMFSTESGEVLVRKIKNHR